VATRREGLNAKDIKAFDKAYKDVIGSAMGAIRQMGYGFIEVTHLKAPVDPHQNYKKPSIPGDVPA